MDFESQLVTEMVTCWLRPFRCMALLHVCVCVCVLLAYGTEGFYSWMCVLVGICERMYTNAAWLAIYKLNNIHAGKPILIFRHILKYNYFFIIEMCRCVYIKGVYLEFYTFCFEWKWEKSMKLPIPCSWHLLREPIFGQ